ncbi:MAG: ImmA/IrrE family metallo-endopeptidase [Gammaproteobacteria bacterium]|nr:MAG: ImmA/IrrE family metallo-endopeptidase [Gammaproteobacteria bacterium]
MMTNTETYSDLAIPPGEYLLEATIERGLSQAELARRMGRPIQAISEIVKGIKAITPDTALQLEQVLDVPAHIWTGLETGYQLALARDEAQKKIEEEAGDVARFPYADMAKLGWVVSTRKAQEKVRELRRFFGVASLDNLSRVHSYAPAFRKSDRDGLSHEALAAWLRAGVLKATDIDTRPFDKAALKELLPAIRNMTCEQPDDFQAQLQQSLADVGIALVLLPHLPKTYTHGATFWMQPDKAVLMMSLRGCWADIFWFSLFHELGHILLHGKRCTFLENGRHDPETQQQEAEADQFASDTLIPKDAYKLFIRDGDFSAVGIRDFAGSIRIAPGIVMGRLQHDAYLPHNNHHYQEKYCWA